MKALKLVEAKPEALADHIGALRAEIKEQQDALKGAEDLLRELVGNNTTVEGKLFRVTFTTAFRDTVSWKKIAEKLGASRQIIRANTSSTPYVRITVTAHKK